MWVDTARQWFSFSKGLRHQATSSLCLDLPALSSILPYESMTDAELFINKQSLGFGLHLAPARGADETLVKAMAELIKNKLPEGADCTVMLVRHHFLENELQYGFEPLAKKGGIYQKLAQMSLHFHRQAAVHGYSNGRHIAAHLADYCVYLFFSMPKKVSSMEAMDVLRQSIESELAVVGLNSSRLGRSDFLSLMQALLVPHAKALDWPKVDDDKEQPLSHLIPSGNGLITVNDLSVDIETSDETGIPQNTRLISCHIEKWPTQLALWQTPDVLANLLRPEHGMACPFLISFSFHGINQTRLMARAKTRAKRLNSNHNAIQQFLNPGMREEREAWNHVYEEGSRGHLALLPTFYNVLLFTTEENEREIVAKAIGSYRQLGFELQQSRATQWVRFLASLPFFMSEGFFDDLGTLGLLKHMTHYNIANLMPIVVDPKGSRQGLLLPTQRGQCFFFDAFDNQTLPITNFNCLTVGSSGAGKSMFQQAQILSGLALNETIYVIDLGHSYKHLCELVGGTYIDVANISLNPFTLFDFEGKTEVQTQEGRLAEIADNIQIRDLLCLMASPHHAVEDVQKSYLLDAARTAWQAKGRAANMDDVLAALRQRIASNGSQDMRLSDLITLLNQYGTQGVYGHLFNGNTPLIQNPGLVVFEMGGFQGNPDLLTIVMFVMIVIIQGQFYQSDRRSKKRCIIDEAWRFLSAGSNPIAAHFIEQGFRTARKYRGGFSVLTQYLDDMEKTVQGQAIVASSDLKIIMRQGNFKAYCEAHPERFNGFQKELIGSFGDVVGTGFSSLMIEAGNTHSFHRYFADPFTRLLFSSSGDEFAAIEALCAEGLSLEQAVERLRVAHET